MKANDLTSTIGPAQRILKRADAIRRIEASYDDDVQEIVISRLPPKMIRVGQLEVLARQALKEIHCRA